MNSVDASRRVKKPTTFALMYNGTKLQKLPSINWINANTVPCHLKTKIPNDMKLGLRCVWLVIVKSVPSLMGSVVAATGKGIRSWDHAFIIVRFCNFLCHI